MNGGDHRATHLGHLVHLGHDDEGGARVETGGGFVEKEHGRVGHELDRDGEHLALTRGEAVGGARGADHATGERAKLENVERLGHESVSRLRGHLVAEAKLRREFERLGNGGELVVQIHLFAVRSAPRKRLLLHLVPVEGDGSLANAASLASGDDVQQGRLTRAGRAHERKHATRARGGRDRLQQLLGSSAGFLRDVHRVFEIFPRD